MSSKTPGQFTFVDLFAGIGGFHAALDAMGGECVYAVEIDPAAAAVYERNWGTAALGDIVADSAGGEAMAVPEHDVLAAGFPCQPFSKSGFQRGMEETRGTLFWNILEVIRVRRPSVVLLENVRNIAGPRHVHEWEVIIRSLRELGYRVSHEAAVFSPHLLPPGLGGRPQVRDRVFITATYVGVEHSFVDVPPPVTRRPVDGWDPQHWSLADDLPLQVEFSREEALRLRLSPAENTWLDAWDDFVATLRADGAAKIPGHPIWADAFIDVADLHVSVGTPAWKENFLRRNAELYTRHQGVIEAWLERWDYLEGFPPSRRKLEWQAQGADGISARDEHGDDQCIVHFRPSGIRVKRATYTPALVAITQTTILGAQRRRLSTKEAGRLQGLPDTFDLGGQAPSAAYKQVGNGVNVGAAYYVLREAARAAAEDESHPEPAAAVVEILAGAPERPSTDPGLESLSHRVRSA